MTPSDIIEAHQAMLGLMWATHTNSVQEALLVLNGIGITDGPDRRSSPSGSL
jgi:hypothetical protein